MGQEPSPLKNAQNASSFTAIWHWNMHVCTIVLYSYTLMSVVVYILLYILTTIIFVPQTGINFSDEIVNLMVHVLQL